MSTRRTPEQRLAELERKRASLAKRVRAEATREKVIVGAAVVAESRANPGFAMMLRTILDARVGRASDQQAIAALLQTLPEPESADQLSAELAIPPITLETESAPPPAGEIDASASASADPFAGLPPAGDRKNRQR